MQYVLLVIALLLARSILLQQLPLLVISKDISLFTPYMNSLRMPYNDLSHNNNDIIECLNIPYQNTLKEVEA